jgi:hypothetical protein
MKSPWLLLLFCGCGVQGGGAPRLPLDVVIDAATGPSVTMLQVVLATPSSQFDPLAHANQCTKDWIPADQALPLTGADGAQHPSQVIALSGNGPQTASVTGIPPAKDLVLVVEGISAEQRLVSRGVKSPIAEITAGENPPVSITLSPISPDGGCANPLY